MLYVARKVDDKKQLMDELCSAFVEDICGNGTDPEAWMVKLPDVPKPPVEEIKLPPVS